ncbi:Putative short-chain type dehydrogenase/reductase [bacterium HR26]|nr:Putative short-chain type dehydrogenase/reductase [bacterium HR26]
MGKLEGKVALVTGAGRGIGRGIALLLAREGAAVVVNDLGTALNGEGQDESVAQQVVAEIQGFGGRAVANTESVADYAAAGRMVEQALEAFGRLDVVVNVAGILRDRMIFNMTEEEWDAVSAVHLNGTFNVCRQASALMRQQGSGRIINFSSVSAWGSPGQPNYAAAKYGILGLTAVLANSMAKYNVTANAILPYATTRMIDSTPRGQEFARVHGKPPSELAEGTEGDPANVAPMVAFLATDEAAGINGHFFGVRGYTISIYSHWELAAVLRKEGGWSPAEIAEVFPSTIGPLLDLPEPVELPGHDRPVRGTAAMQANPSSWREIAPGIQLWERRVYYDAKR